MNKKQHYKQTRISLVFLVTLFLAGFSATTVGATAALTQGGSIKGKVVADIPEQRRALPGVVVTLSGDRLGDKKLQSITDSEGQFDFTGLIAGDYTVTVEFTGFKKYEQKLSVQIEATVEHNILLQAIPLSESV